MQMNEHNSQNLSDHHKCRIKKPAAVLCVLAAVFCAAALAVFAVISPGKPPAEPPVLEGADPIELPVLIGGGDASWENCVRQVASRYMADHPDVTVVVRQTLNVENMDYARGLIVEEALGHFDGVVEMRNPALYVSAGKLTPVPDSLAVQFKQTKQYDGQVYSVPRYYSCRGIIYNRRLFEQYQIEVPDTYPDFLAVCRKLKDLGICPLTMGAKDLWHLNHWCSGLFFNDVLLAQPDWIAQRNAGAVHWSDEAPMKMLSDFRDLFELGYVDPDFAVTTDAQTIEMLTAENAAMLYSGTWLFSQIQKTDPQFDFGWFFLPNYDTLPLVELNGNWEWAITASCKENGLYDTAVDFLEYFYSADIYPTVLQDMNGFSSLKTDVDYPGIPVQEEIARLTADRGRILTNTLETADAPEGFSSILYTNMLRMAEGRQSLQETAAILDKEWDERNEPNE